MSCGVLKRLTGSLRFRLTLWYTCVVLFLLVVSLFFLHQAIKQTLLRLLDEFLVEERTTVLAEIEERGTDRAQLYERLNRQAWRIPDDDCSSSFSTSGGNFFGPACIRPSCTRSLTPGPNSPPRGWWAATTSFSSA